MLQITGGNLANLLPNIATIITVLGAIINQFACALLACYNTQHSGCSSACSMVKMQESATSC